MSRRRKVTWLTSASALLGALVVVTGSYFATAGDGAEPFRFEVKLTNLTRGQIFSPAVVATHTQHMEPLFMGGQPASDELAAVAEDAILDPLITRLEASSEVGGVVVLTGENGPIFPGETATVVVAGSASASRLSLVGMLVTTNDAFYALNSEPLSLHQSVAHSLLAYDAGSEANNELCAYIPGPPCNNPGVRAPDGAEGYVHVHAGIHGGGDLDAAERDWRNPVARVTVRRLLP